MIMNRITFVIAAAAVGVLGTVPAWAHLNDEHEHDEPVQKVAVEAEAKGDESNLKFRVLYDSTHLPEKAQSVLRSAHGGFAVDRRPGKGETYFALPGAGIIQISADFKTTKLLETDSAVRDKNQHNATIWYEGDNAYLAFPGNQSAAVFTTDLDGNLLHTLSRPAAESFEHPGVRQYFTDGKRFVPTDVEMLNGRYYVTTGYSALDFVLTAGIKTGEGFSAEWGGLVFGGKGGGPGQFGTGHGITVTPDRQIAVADRPHSEVDSFAPHGKYMGTLKLPKGSFPCDVDYDGGLMVVGCLHGPDRSKGAPIYILKGDHIIATIMCKEELGLEKFTHIHNATIRVVNDTIYVIAQAWNPGDFVILEQVK